MEAYMHGPQGKLGSSVLILAFISCATNALAQPSHLDTTSDSTLGTLAPTGDNSRLAQPAQVSVDSVPASRWAVDVGIGIDVSVNGNVNSGVIGRLQGQATAILPNSYGDVYGTGLHFRGGLGYRLNNESEARAALTYQSADANLVRLGDIGPSSLYGQYSDYKTLGLDFGYRRYVPLSNTRLRVYGEVSIGLAFIDEINVLLAAPQANIVFDNTDFYDSTASFTWGLNIGVLFPIATQVDLNAQLGLRRGSGLAEVDQLVGTGLDEINNDSARITFPIVVGVRFRF
jgi:Outer membrane protein beta-barrel domain